MVICTLQTKFKKPKAPKKVAKKPDGVMTVVVGGCLVRKTVIFDDETPSVESTEEAVEPPKKKKRSNEFEKLTKVHRVNGLSKQAAGKVGTALTGAMINTGAGTEKINIGGLMADSDATEPNEEDSDSDSIFNFKPAAPGTKRERKPVSYA